MYDVAIIGTGPAGYTASIYASRYKLKSIIIGEQLGGQVSESTYIENYPSYVSIKGPELIQKIRDHALHYGVEEVFDGVDTIQGKDGDFKVTTINGKTYNAKTLILSLGAKRRKLGVPGESEFSGKGVAYCTTCDGPLYKDKVVAVIGGSDAANTSSLYLSDIAKQVYQIYRGDHLRGEQIWADQVLNNPKITVLFNTNVEEIVGDTSVKSVTLDREFKGSKNLKIDGIFIEIGSQPVTALSNQLGLEIEDTGLIVVGPDQKTNIEGIWAAGDITTNSDNFNQIITASAEAAIAARNAFIHIRKSPAKN
jgi:thioredoxin reductase (NADPH)